MTTYTNEPRSTSLFELAAEKLGSVSRWFDAHTVRGHAIRRAELMMKKDDADLAALGLTRDKILQHAFSRYAC